MISLATRGSALALAQTELVLRELQRLYPEHSFETSVIESEGDLRPEATVPEMPGTGWFTTRLERALVKGEVQGAVHSAKDLPTRLEDGLTIGAYLPRADPRDALVTAAGGGLPSLREGARVGTSSVRRISQLRALRQDLRLEPLRGNVDSRLARVLDGRIDAVVVAMAGLQRLGREAEAHPLDPATECTPAPAQGAVAVEVCVGSELHSLVMALDHRSTRSCVEAERTALRRLGGSCLLPLGAYAREVGQDGVELTLAWGETGEPPSVRRLVERCPIDQLAATAARLADQLR